MTKQRVTVAEAAELLGISVEAVRMRIKRGQLEGQREAGRVFVWLDTDQTPSDSDALISAKDETIATLREQLEAERQAHSEARRLLMAALERIPPQLEPPREAPGASAEGAEPNTASTGSQEGSERPWWRRMFGS